MSLEDLFCDIDDFCRLFLPAWHRQLLTDSARQRQRASRLTLSEIMTILIYFHQSQYRVVSLSFRDELSDFSDRLAFSMEFTVPSRRSAWTGKRCIVRTVGASITENLLKLDG